MNKFTIKKNKLLIELVKKNPVLYDPSDPNFKNCIAKHVIWENISSIMDISAPDIKRRWKHFRDHFHKKQKAENAGHPTFHTTWYYKRHLQFLDQYSTYKDKVKNNSKDTKEVEEVLDSRVEDTVEEGTDKDSKAIDPKERVDDSKEDVNESVLEINEIAEIEELKTEQDESDLIDDEMVLGSEPVSEEIPMKEGKKIDTLAAVLEKRLAEKFRFETSKLYQSPTHKFFESMADIVAQFPPHLVAESRLKVCQLVNEIEMKKHKEQEFLCGF